MKKLLVLPLFFFLLIEAFDQNIPELVENTSPAVVNITSKREVTYSNQDYFRGMPEESLKDFLVFLEISDNSHKQENLLHMDQASSLKKTTF